MNAWYLKCPIESNKCSFFSLNNADKPKFESSEEKVSVVEGEAAVVTVKAKANPDQIKYKWSKNNTPKPKKLFIDGPVLNLTEVTRKEKGKYECEASNIEGSTVYTIDLDVQCKLEPQKKIGSSGMLILLNKNRHFVNLKDFKRK